MRERIIIRSTKRNIELYGSLNNTLISKSNMSKKIVNILFLGYEETMRGG
jgi:hypothetical protein